MAESEKKNLHDKIIEKALKDDEFKERLKKNPEETIKNDFGLEMPAGIKIKVIEDSKTLKHLVIPEVVEGKAGELSDAELEVVVGGVAPHTGQATLMCDTAWQTCWICG